MHKSIDISTQLTFHLHSNIVIAVIGKLSTLQGPFLSGNATYLSALRNLKK